MSMQTSDLLMEHFRLKPAQAKALKKLGLLTVKNLLHHLPARYTSQDESVVAKVISQGTRKGWHKRVAIAEMALEDLSGGKVKAIWFSQAYMAKKFSEGAIVRLSGKSKEYKGARSFTNPTIELANKRDMTGPLFSSDLINDSHQLAPIYPESRGISSLWLTYAIQKVLKSGIMEKLEDPIPKEILVKYKLPSLHSSLIFIHNPKRESDAKAARKRFAFQEIFFIQLARQKLRQEYVETGAYQIKKTSKISVPFTPTRAQDEALEKILADMKHAHPMMRLLEGDVGSGKTYVAVQAAHAVMQSPPAGGLQVAYMAPTEILAKQHFESFIQMFKLDTRYPTVQIGLLTGSECRKFPSKIEVSGHTQVARTQLLKWIADGSMSIVIGTHAHIAESVKWKRLALVIIDEQHRFGTKQRATLAQKNLEIGSPSGGSISKFAPHLLSMTATPIPRTLALTIYGDLDLTLLDESPPGRKPIITKIVNKHERAEVYEHIRREIKSGRQAYVICPRINEPDPEKELALETKDVMSEVEKLGNEIFPEFIVAGLHGKMKPSEKDEIMQEFANNEINILVATSVIEVGINIPNATIIIIEGAERFGLAQLHQLRGRVLRSSMQAHCYLFTSKEDASIPARLKALEKAKSGFELAEQDLKLRGPGSLIGSKQWGISDVGMEALQNLKMVEAARTEARAILEADPELKNHPLLSANLATKPHHFE